MVWADSLLLPQRTRATGTFSGVDANPVVIGNAVFGVSSNGLLAANALNKGVRIWELPVSSMHTPWVSGAFLFLLSTDDQLLCISARDGRITRDEARIINQLRAREAHVAPPVYHSRPWYRRWW